jgi:hypothetical protein
MKGRRQCRGTTGCHVTGVIIWISKPHPERRVEFQYDVYEKITVPNDTNQRQVALTATSYLHVALGTANTFVAMPP